LLEATPGFEPGIKALQFVTGDSRRFGAVHVSLPFSLFSQVRYPVTF